MAGSSIRELQETRERAALSPYARLSADTAGRARQEEQCPLRTDFQRDRDRVVHSKAFRRLSHKAQVFIDPEEDHYRTRLTHTLEVSQIARTAARALALNEDLTEAIALGHDLGHTPFGHAGERALHAAYREFVPTASFRHSEQSLRVVDFLEKDGRGINLTMEVRMGILHHSKGSADTRFGESPRVNTLEGEVVRIADRIAYINHDVDDAIRAEAIEESEIPRDIAGILGDRHSARITTMVNDLVAHSQGRPELRMSDAVVAAMDGLKDFLFQRVYDPDACGPRSEELRSAARMVREMFRYCMDNPDVLPRWRAADTASPESLARAVCDYIAGMTDRYAERFHAEYVAPTLR